MRRRKTEDKYKYKVRKEQIELEEFAVHENEWAGHLITLYQCRKRDMPVDEYRGCSFFLNKEFQKKPKSLTLLYELFLQCFDELPEITRENAFDILRFRFRMYAQALEKGGY